MIVYETNQPPDMERMRRDAEHAHANVRHDRKLSAGERQERGAKALQEKGPLTLEVHKRVRAESNARCYIVIAYESGEKKAVKEYLGNWT